MPNSVNFKLDNFRGNAMKGRGQKVCMLPAYFLLVVVCVSGAWMSDYKSKRQSVSVSLCVISVRVYVRLSLLLCVDHYDVSALVYTALH